LFLFQLMTKCARSLVGITNKSNMKDKTFDFLILIVLGLITFNTILATYVVYKAFIEL
jgi:hypothetical protein